ncbi:MAG: hypothetical protein ACLP1D_20910 [Xanthobacteraceae bacterium]
MSSSRGVFAAPLAIAMCGCSVVPDIPRDDFSLPIRAILWQTACELQETFVALDGNPALKRFKAQKWLVSVSLAPKADTDVNVSGGVTRKSLHSPVNFSSWNVSGPGLQLDDKGERSSGITFNFKSADLMKDKTLKCPPDIPSVHALAQHLGVGSWLYRTAEAMAVASSATIDKPIYDTDITVKLAGNGTYTWNFAPGTNVVGFGGSYSLDEQLNITMAPIAETKKLTVTSLPVGDAFTAPISSTVQVQSAQNRLDLVGIEQAIRKLQPSP